jgi:hypothetical protein
MAAEAGGRGEGLRRRKRGVRERVRSDVWSRLAPWPPRHRLLLCRNRNSPFARSAARRLAPGPPTRLLGVAVAIHALPRQPQRRRPVRWGRSRPAWPLADQGMCTESSRLPPGEGGKGWEIRHSDFAAVLLSRVEGGNAVPPPGRSVSDQVYAASLPLIQP